MLLVLTHRLRFPQVGMAGTAAVITVTFIHPIDVVKVSSQLGRVAHAVDSREVAYYL